jgi:hypothetical protein
MTDTTCRVDGCSDPVRCRELCNKHYIRLRIKGTTDWVSTRKREHPNSVCYFPGCTNGSVRISGYCLTHETRIRRYGDPGVQPTRFLPFFHMVTAEKVRSAYSRLVRDPDTGCLNTQTRDPRARINLGNDGTRIVYARVYQVTWAWLHQRDPVATIDHLCANPRCANPYHLEECSDRENTLRHYRRKRGTTV